MITQSPNFWIFLPVALLLGSLGMGVTTVILATSDPAFAVEEDYYERSQHVDEALAQQAETRALGWKLRTLDRRFVIEDAQTRVAFRVIGPDNQPVTGLTGTLRAFHNARAAQVQSVDVQADPLEPGVYFLDLAVDREGWWVWRYDLQRQDDRARGEYRTRMVAVAPEVLAEQ